MYKLGYAYALAGRVTEAIALMVASLDRIVASRGGHTQATTWLGEGYLLSAKSTTPFGAPRKRSISRDAWACAGTRRWHSACSRRSGGAVILPT